MVRIAAQAEYKKLNKDGLNKVFINACYLGQIDVIKYVLSSKDLKEHANIHTDNDDGFKVACGKGYLDVVKYLLSSKELKDKIDIHTNEDIGFRHSCVCQHFDILKYFILEAGIEKTKKITDFLAVNKSEEFIKTISEMFVVRELKKDLSDSLCKGKNKNIKKL